MVRSRCRSAFTLVELLVVIGVIGLLLSILMPALAKSRRAANEVVCQSNLYQFGVALQEYADQNKGFLPQKGPDGSTKAQSFGTLGTGNKVASLNNVIGYNDPSLWFNALPPLVNNRSYYQMIVDASRNLTPLPCGGGNPNIFICPDMGPAIVRTGVSPDISLGSYYELYGYDSTDTVKNSTGLLPKGNFFFDCSYVWNSKMTGYIGQVNELDTMKMTTLRAAAEDVVMVEKIGDYQEYQDPTVQQYNNTYSANGAGGPYSGDIDSQGYRSNVGQSKADWRRFTTRHRHGGHLLFADGHVAWFSWTQAQIQPNRMPGNVYNGSRSDANQPGVMIWSPIGPIN